MGLCPSAASTAAAAAAPPPVTTDKDPTPALKGLPLLFGRGPVILGRGDTKSGFEAMGLPSSSFPRTPEEVEGEFGLVSVKE